jgi:murein DD-endopeptidase MepM/ murein hydrolase activator NlpD
VDLYAPEGTAVLAVESGTVVVIEPFTGPAAGSAWWQDTQAVFVEGASGVVVYGELRPAQGLALGDLVQAGQVIGHLTPVLRQDKGRPGCMLHLELHVAGTRDAPGWDHGRDRPATLCDPTPRLLACGKVPGDRAG